MSGSLRQLLVCPGCRGALSWTSTAAGCAACGASYDVVDGIPVLLPPSSYSSYKAEQARAHDEKADPAIAALEVTRPVGTPRFYGWLFAEKYRRSLLGAPPAVRTALTVCGGSGIDAHFLARSGMQVIASDISLGSALRSAERSRRFGLDVLDVVADVERLPLRDRTVDLVYVHDGLHHLERSGEGIAEMARVAGRALSVTEPGRAGATAIAVRLGIAEDVEASGNRVHRFTVAELRDALASNGFEPRHVERYAMYYRHVPGRFTHLLSRARVFPVATASFEAANRLLGRGGNKITASGARSPR